jgi:CheY-like chemotaxis protein
MTPLALKANPKKVGIGPMKHYGTDVSILVIDDDADYLSLLSFEIARATGAQVSVAHSLEEAVELLCNEHFELVVCDWSLASRTGPEVLTTADPLILVNFKTPVMFMSGSEKVGATQRLQCYEHFEPVSFILKRLGPLLISVMAENIILRFYSRDGLQPQSAYLS